MAQLNLTVIRADTNAAFDVELPDDVSIPEILVDLVKEMGLPRSDSTGQFITYELSSKRTGSDLASGTFGSRGVKDGDLLLLTSTFVAG